MRLRTTSAAIVVALLVVGCGSDEPTILTTIAPTTTAPATTPAPTEPVTIDAALDAANGTELLVVAPLIATGDDVRLCGAVMESYPPQCGEPSLPLEGLSLDAVVGLTRPGPEYAEVVWTDFPLLVFGTMQDGVLMGAAPIQATASVDDTKVQLSLAVSPEPIAADGGVVWLIDVTNLAETPLVLHFVDGQSADVIITDESGTEVYRWSAGQAFTDALWDQTIEPGATWSIQLHDALPLDPGRYLASATVTADNAPKLTLSLGIDVE
jgi:hypothetical protein